MEFQLERGLRQGDSLAPFLFILAMEGFHIAMEDAIEAKKLIGINIGDRLKMLWLGIVGMARVLLGIGDVLYVEELAFIKNRQILDGPMILNEVVHTLKRKKKKVMIFKVDIVKAYDTLSWDNLIFVIRFIRFGNKCVRWNKACLESARFSVIVNGSPIMEFQLECGLRQGDPLAHFLFILAMKASGLQISVVKSKLYGIGATETELNHLAGLAGLLGSLPTYYLLLFRMPRTVCNKLEAMRSKFFWGAEDTNRKIHWVKWDLDLASKDHGEFKNDMVGDRWNGLSFAWNWRRPLRGGTEDDQYHRIYDIIKQVAIYSKSFIGVQSVADAVEYLHFGKSVGKRTGALHGDDLVPINPLLRRSCRCSGYYCISDGARWYGALSTGVTPGTKSIWNSTSLGGGSPGKSLGNTLK
nr:RNA-directed DNA polymerase, eukaryota, reverse transcriptase zinc-binding domain protein [Tanacetum cinerariifolium]